MKDMEWIHISKEMTGKGGRFKNAEFQSQNKLQKVSGIKLRRYKIIFPYFVWKQIGKWFLGLGYITFKINVSYFLQKPVSDASRVTIILIWKFDKIYIYLVGQISFDAAFLCL